MAAILFSNPPPVIDITDSNDRGSVQVHISGYDNADPTFEADVVGYIRGRIGSVANSGATSAQKSVVLVSSL